MRFKEEHLSTLRSHIQQVVLAPALGFGLWIYFWIFCCTQCTEYKILSKAFEEMSLQVFEQSLVSFTLSDLKL